MSSNDTNDDDQTIANKQPSGQRRVGMLLNYEQELYKEMFANEASLLIMAEGMGIERIFLNFLKLYSDASHLVLVLNTHEADEDYFIEQLKQESGACIYGNQNNTTAAAATTKRQQQQLDTMSIQLPTRITTETHTVAERVETYLKGGCFFVTSRILVVDMLTDRVPIDLVSGILVYNAHKVIDSCQETFILRMFRQKNKKGFIKAFSDNPVYFTRGFSKVEKVMKNLFCTKLFIYPRFHVDVDAELSADAHKPELVEVHIGLNENTSRIQMALLDIINVLLKEFRDCCSYIDHDFLTMEMVISRPFDQLVKSQLDPVWNQLGSKPKQLISDIKTLRLLIYYLTQYDCITFYKMLSCLRSYEKELGRSSGWMFLDAANELFSRARLRVYGNESKTIYTKADLNNRYFYMRENKDLVRRIIEESPKLKTMKQIIEELESEDNRTSEISVLIVAKDDRTCSQIKHFLQNNKLTRSIRSKDKTKQGGGNEDKEDEADKLAVFEQDKQEEREDEFIVRMLIRPVHTESNDDDNDEHRHKSGNKQTLTQMARKKKHDGAAAAKRKLKTVNRLQDDNEPVIVEDDDDDDDEEDQEDEVQDDDEMNNSISSQDLNAEAKASAAATAPCTKQQRRMNKLVYLCALEEGSKQKVSVLKLLYEVKPKYVILYDCVLWFVRQLEVYKTLHNELAMRVYFLMYTNSCEEQRYLTAVRCEKESFEILIREKATMIVPNEQDGKLETAKKSDAKKTDETEIEQRESISSQAERLKRELEEKKRRESLLPRGSSAAADAEAEDETPRIIVDIREFRSELPSILHKKGFRIEPVTLEVGDYVITPSMAVERKSINDLIESLANGRLYNQVNAMSRSYKYPVLLIEFDQNKPFQLNSYQSLASNEISPHHVSSKLALLTIHFPRLRILWCSSCAETADIFDELKANCPQPDAQTAMSIKTDVVTEDDDLKYNPVLKDILFKIPGINSKNVNSLMAKIENLLELFAMSEEDVNKIIENSKNAKAIVEFVNKSIRDDGVVNEIRNEFGFEDVNDFYVNDDKPSGAAAAASATKSTKELLKIGRAAMGNPEKRPKTSKRTKK